jgi:hypothetical protein
MPFEDDLRGPDFRADPESFLSDRLERRLQAEAQREQVERAPVRLVGADRARLSEARVIK